MVSDQHSMPGEAIAWCRAEKCCQTAAAIANVKPYKITRDAENEPFNGSFMVLTVCLASHALSFT